MKAKRFQFITSDFVQVVDLKQNGEPMRTVFKIRKNGVIKFARKNMMIDDLRQAVSLYDEHFKQEKR